MNREQLNARAVELGAVAEEVGALETKAAVQAVIDALTVEIDPAVKSAVVAMGKAISCSRRGLVKAGAVVKPGHFTDPKTFDELCGRKILVSEGVYADQVKRAATNEDREG